MRISLLLFVVSVLTPLIQAKHHGGTNKKRLGKPKSKKNSRKQTHAKTFTDSQVVMNVVDGWNAQSNEFPFYVRGALCGASLIWHDVILSAGHCLGKLQSGTNGVLVGAAVSGSTANGAQWRNITVEYAHPGFNVTALDYDMMVAKLESPVTNPALQPVPLNRQMWVPRPGSQVTAIGFGRISETGPVPTMLQMVNLTSLSAKQCTKQYAKFDTSVNPLTMLCTLGRGRGGVCFGDSGGPLLLNGLQVGITSWTLACGSKRYPDVYTRLAVAIDWIEQQICLLSKVPPDSCSNKVYYPTASGN